MTASLSADDSPKLKAARFASRVLNAINLSIFLGSVTFMLKVIGAGFGRTGTHSLKLALETLGFGPCHHMFEIKHSSEQLELWHTISKTLEIDWNNVFAGYLSQVDWPGVNYWRQLTKAFPNSKVVLTYRDPKSWYQSFMSTIVRANRAGVVDDPNPHTRAMAEIVEDIVFRQTFDDRPEDENHAISIYLKHMADVMTEIPRERLLLYNVSEGWQPLCDFLDVEVPSVPFPSTNSKEDFLARKTFLTGVVKKS